MDKIVVKKIKSKELSNLLREMPIGGELHISDKQFRTQSVYHACYRLRKEGYTFRCSVKGIVGGCAVERTN